MKKFFALLLTLSMVFMLASCGNGGSAGGSAASGSGAAGASGGNLPSYTITFAHDCGNGTPTFETAEMFKKLIEERSNGRIKVDLYPRGELSGNDASKTSSMLGSGDIQMSAINGLQTALWDVYKFPYLLSTLEEAYKSEEGESGKYMLDSLKESGILGLSFWDVGFRVFTAKKSLADVKDVKGLKLRIISSQAFTAFAQALGATPVSTTMGELYTALQQGSADCQENPLATICSRNLYEVTPYVTLTNHVWTYYIFAVNQKWFESLPKEDQQLIQDINKECTAHHRKIAEELQQGYKDKIVAAGGKIIDLTDAQREEWVKIGRSTHKDLESIVGANVLDLFYKDLGIKKPW